MAKYIGTITSDARGKVGGLVLTRARNGTNLKAHAVPVNTRSLTQSINRATFSAANSAWQALSATNKTGWTVLAANYTWLNSLAQPYVPTGQQLYTQAYVNARVFTAYPPTTAPGSPPVIAPVTSVQILSGPTFLEIFAYNGGSGYAGAWIAYLTRPLSAGSTYMTTRSRRLIGHNNSGNLITGTTTYTEAFGAPPDTGSNIGFRVVPVDPASLISGTILIGSFITYV